MDKIELTVADIEALLTWRDQHPNEVRSHPEPLKAVEIVMPHNGYRIKGIREGNRLKLHLSQNSTQLGNCEFVRRADGMWMSTKNRMKVDKDDLQSVLTVYCSLMALMTYGSIETEAPQDRWTQEFQEVLQEAKPQDHIHTPNGQWDAHGGPKRLPRKPQRYLHRPGTLPAL